MRENAGWCAVMAAGVAVFAAGGLRAQGITPEMLAKMREVQAWKTAFSPAERKLDTQLILLSQQERNVPIPGALLEGTATDVRARVVQPDGLATVDIKADVNPGLLDFLTRTGAQVVSVAPLAGALRARIQPATVFELAARSDVRRITTPEQAATNSLRLRGWGAPVRMLAPTSARLAGGSLGPQLPHLFFIGALTAQGYVSHNAKHVVETLGYKGAGVKVGVLSDSASAARIATLIASGDLRADTVVLPGQAGSGTDEGTAMMEIVADMAPQAQLYFATAFGGQASFAANIQALAAAGCTVIVDDVTYLLEPAFQDGTIAKAVNTVSAAGVVYFSSAGNSGSKTANTSGTYEADFVNSGGNHLFAAGQAFNRIVSARTSNVISLKWSDPLGGSANDYDLYIFNSTGTTLKAASTAAQTGTQDPVEAVQLNTAANDRVVVNLFSGDTRAFRVETNRNRLTINTPSATYGHNAGANTVSSAAVFWNSARTGTRPFVGGASNPNETFSSDGPRRIFFNPDGSAITPGNFLIDTNGGQVLIKPDLAGADGVSTKTPGFLPFYGTSAGAPHLAGIAALVRSAKPALTRAQVISIMQTTALDNMAAGVDRDSGYGIAMANKAVAQALLP